MSYFDFESIQFESDQMSTMVSLAKKLSKTSANIIISGDPGVGKSSLARYIHKKSHIKKLIDFNAFDANALLLDSTLLIEDVDQLNFESQKKLSEILSQAGENRPRVIATTRKSIKQLVRHDKFKESLFYKLSIIQIEIPSLNEIKKDIEKIASFVLKVSEIIHGKSGMSFSNEALEKIKKWQWPGNITELENVIERAVLLSSSAIITEDFIQIDHRIEGEKNYFNSGMSLFEVEKCLILQTLELTAQNRTRAAQILGISIRTLRNKLHEYKNEEVL